MSEIYLDNFNKKVYSVTHNYLIYDNVKYNELELEIENINDVTIYFLGDSKISHNGGNFYPCYDSNTIECVDIIVLRHKNESYVLIEGRIIFNYYIKLGNIDKLVYYYDTFESSPVGGCGKISCCSETIENSEFVEISKKPIIYIQYKTQEEINKLNIKIKIKYLQKNYNFEILNKITNIFINQNKTYSFCINEYCLSIEYKNNKINFTIDDFFFVRGNNFDEINDLFKDDLDMFVRNKENFNELLGLFMLSDINFIRQSLEIFQILQKEEFQFYKK